MHTSLRKQRAGIFLHGASEFGSRHKICEDAALESSAEDELVVGGDEEFVGARVDVWEEDAAWSYGARVDEEAGAD
jgi:hypothetical protein